MKKIIFGLFFLLSNNITNAAINPFINYALDINTSKKFGFLFETNFRTYSNLFNLKLFVFRLGVQYNLTSNHEKTKLQIGLGYAFKDQFSSVSLTNQNGIPLGDATFYLQNHIIWQQIQGRHQILPIFNLIHRVRFEQDFRSTFLSDNFSNIYPSEFGYFITRVRLLIRPELYLVDASKDIAPYIAVQEELFLKIHGNKLIVSPTLIQENRLAVFIGLKIKSNTKIELGYMNNQGPNSNNLDSHFFQLQCFSNLNLFK